LVISAPATPVNVSHPVGRKLPVTPPVKRSTFCVVVIEALWAGLPLLLSSRVGNHPDLLRPGLNGWLFDPESRAAVQTAVGAWACADDQQLAACGAASAALARQHFRSDAIVEAFLDQVLTSLRPGRASAGHRSLASPDV